MFLDFTSTIILLLDLSMNASHIALKMYYLLKLLELSYRVSTVDARETKTQMDLFYVAQLRI